MSLSQCFIGICLFYRISSSRLGMSKFQKKSINLIDRFYGTIDHFVTSLSSAIGAVFFSKYLGISHLHNRNTRKRNTDGNWRQLVNDDG